MGRCSATAADTAAPHANAGCARSPAAGHRLGDTGRLQRRAQRSLVLLGTGRPLFSGFYSGRRGVAQPSWQRVAARKRMGLCAWGPVPGWICHHLGLGKARSWRRRHPVGHAWVRCGHRVWEVAGTCARMEPGIGDWRCRSGERKEQGAMQHPYRWHYRPPCWPTCDVCLSSASCCHRHNRSRGKRSPPTPRGSAPRRPPSAALRPATKCCCGILRHAHSRDHQT
jgi:hypothetical protein